MPDAAEAQRWLANHLVRRAVVVVPEVIDFEVRRELTRLRKTRALARLDEFNSALPGRYLPINTAAMRRAATLWADVRRRGLPTVDPKELDVDVILAAQVLTAGLPQGETVVATGNVVHLSRYVSARHWSDI